MTCISKSISIECCVVYYCVSYFNKNESKPEGYLSLCVFHHVLLNSLSEAKNNRLFVKQWWYHTWNYRRKQNTMWKWDSDTHTGSKFQSQGIYTL